MANAPRVKGTRAESAAARWLTELTGVTFRRNALAGTLDCGDVRGDGLDWLVVEVKNTKIPSPKVWARELAAEQRNAGAEHGVILWSPPGVGMNSVDEWVAIEPYATRLCPRDFVRHYGPVNSLHKFVAHMARDREGVILETEGLVAFPAGEWGAWLCNEIAQRSKNVALT